MNSVPVDRPMSGFLKTSCEFASYCPETHPWRPAAHPQPPLSCQEPRQHGRPQLLCVIVPQGCSCTQLLPNALPSPRELPAAFKRLAAQQREDLGGSLLLRRAPQRTRETGELRPQVLLGGGGVSQSAWPGPTASQSRVSSDFSHSPRDPSRVRETDAQSQDWQLHEDGRRTGTFS